MSHACALNSILLQFLILNIIAIMISHLVAIKHIVIPMLLSKLFHSSTATMFSRIICSLHISLRHMLRLILLKKMILSDHSPLALHFFPISLFICLCLRVFVWVWVWVCDGVCVRVWVWGCECVSVCLFCSLLVRCGTPPGVNAEPVEYNICIYKFLGLCSKPCLLPFLPLSCSLSLSLSLSLSHIHKLYVFIHSLLLL